ncbi:MAG: co-chaperone GroES [Phycisphaerales bacterium]|nr:MAG: co-chaperone GroES [Phycisphaerales bacterium]
MKLRPLDDRIVIRQSEAEEKTAGGIILPDAAREKPQIGTVVAIGPGKLLDDGTRGKMSVKNKNEVIYAKYIGSDVEIDGQKYVILRESDVLGTVER